MCVPVIAFISRLYVTTDTTEGTETTEMAAERKALLDKVRFALRGSGLLVKEVPAVVMRRASQHTVAQLNAAATQEHASASSRRAALVALHFKRAIAGVARDDFLGLCHPGPGLQNDFVRKVLGDVGGGGLRTDSKTVLAYRMTGPAARRVYKVVGVASYGEASEVSTEDYGLEFLAGNQGGDLVTAHQAHALNSRLANHRLVEIDLVCSKSDDFAHGGPGRGRTPVPNTRIPGLASLLVAFCLAKASTQKRQGHYKYEGAVVKAVSPTMRNVVRVMGLTQVAVQQTHDDGGHDIGLDYRVISGPGWVARVGEKITPPPALCVVPGSARCT